MDQRQAKKHFLEAYDAHADELFRFCFMKVSSGDRAEDLVQDVFTRYWQTLRGGMLPDNPRSFLYTLARNRVIDWYRKKKTVSLDLLQDAGKDFSGTGHKEIVDAAQLREVLEAVNDLDETSREALLLRFVEGWTPKEIAQLNGESANAVSVRINRALAKVRTNIHVEE